MPQSKVSFIISEGLTLCEPYFTKLSACRLKFIAVNIVIKVVFFTSALEGFIFPVIFKLLSVNFVCEFVHLALWLGA